MGTNPPPGRREKKPEVREQPGAAVAEAAVEREPTRVPAKPAEREGEKAAAPPLPKPTLAAPEEFKEGDKVKFKGKDGERLTGTVRSQTGQQVSIDVDQIAAPGGVPIGRIERKCADQIEKVTAPRYCCTPTLRSKS